MNFKETPLTQSIIHRFLFKGEERDILCPKRIYLTDIIKTHGYSTESMNKGHYFETLCLGRGADGKSVTDMPRKSLPKRQVLENMKRKELKLPEIKGDKTLDQVRIEEQAVRFKALCAKYQVVVSEGNTQLRAVIPWSKNPDVLLSCGFDIFPTTIMTNEGLELAIIDLKLTADINTSFGEYCWGAPEFMDHIQAHLYSYVVRQLIENIDMNPHMKDVLTKPAVELILQNRVSFYYWVFGYKKLDDKLVKVDWNATKENELHEAIRKCVALIEYYEGFDWPAKPHFKLCKECTVFECALRSTIQTV